MRPQTCLSAAALLTALLTALCALLPCAANAQETQNGDGHTSQSPRVKMSECNKPEYPARALRREAQGTVSAAMLVNKEGRVTDARITKSSGHPDLDRAVLAAFARCRFDPALIDGVPEQSWTQLSYKFSLDGGFPPRY